MSMTGTLIENPSVRRERIFVFAMITGLLTRFRMIDPALAELFNQIPEPFLQ
jgi:hypothetical protein